MKRPGMTAAELQIEALRQLKQGQGKRKAAPVPPAPKPVPLPASKDLEAAVPVGAMPAPGPFELSEQPKAKTRREGPALPLSRETWKRLRDRQRESKEFRTRREMGEWAAELLLALPPQSHKLNAAAKAELFKRMGEWAQARGL